MIRLSAKTEYALRAMMDLAAPAQGRTTLPAIAARQGIPPKFLPMVMTALIQTGLARAIRGYGGGVELARDPHAITVRQIVESLDGPLHIVPSADAPFHHVLEAAGEALCAVLDSVTLADLLVPEARGVNAGRLPCSASMPHQEA